jgi:hypothetical protein
MKTRRRKHGKVDRKGKKRRRVAISSGKRQTKMATKLTGAA